MDLTNANSVVSLMNSVLAPASKVGGSSASGDAAKPSVDFGAVLNRRSTRSTLRSRRPRPSHAASRPATPMSTCTT